MQKVKIIYKNRVVEFTTEQIFYKNEYWMRMLGYLPEGKGRKKWFPIDGRHDDNNDYTGTIVEITEV